MRRALLICILLCCANVLVWSQATVSNIQVTTVEGQQFDLYEELKKGRAVLMDFWWVECLNCELWAPDVQELYEYYDENTEEMFVVGLNIMQTGIESNNNQGIKAFKHRLGLTYPDAGYQGNSPFGVNLIENYYYNVIQPIVNQTQFAQCLVILPDQNLAEHGEIKWFSYGVISQPAGYAIGQIKKMMIENQVRQKYLMISGREDLESTGPAIMVFPNPAEDFINVVAEGPPRPLKIEMYDMTGRMVISENGTMSGQLQVETSSLNTGIYALSVTTEEGTSSRKVQIR